MVATPPTKELRAAFPGRRYPELAKYISDPTGRGTNGFIGPVTSPRGNPSKNDSFTDVSLEAALEVLLQEERYLRTVTDMKHLELLCSYEKAALRNKGSLSLFVEATSALLLLTELLEHFQQFVELRTRITSVLRFFSRLRSYWLDLPACTGHDRLR